MTLPDPYSLYWLAANRHCQNHLCIVTFISFISILMTLGITRAVFGNLLLREKIENYVPHSLQLQQLLFANSVEPSRCTAECYNVTTVPLMTIPYTYRYRCGFIDTVEQAQTVVALCISLCLHSDCLCGNCLYGDGDVMSAHFRLLFYFKSGSKCLHCISFWFY